MTNTIEFKIRKLASQDLNEYINEKYDRNNPEEKELIFNHINELSHCQTVEEIIEYMQNYGWKDTYIGERRVNTDYSKLNNICVRCGSTRTIFDDDMFCSTVCANYNRKKHCLCCGIRIFTKWHCEYHTPR